jgi:hypothetical protein
MTERPDGDATADATSRSRTVEVDMGLPLGQVFRNERRRQLRKKAQNVASVGGIAIRFSLRFVLGGADGDGDDP